MNTWIVLIIICFIIFKVHAAVQKKQREKEKELNRLRTNSINNAIARVKRRIKSGKYEEAFEELNETERLDTQKDYKYTIALYRANVKCQLGRYQEAVTDYNQAIKYHWGGIEAHTNLGFAKHKLGEPREAIKNFDEAIKLNKSMGIDDKSPYYHKIFTLIKIVSTAPEIILNKIGIENLSEEDLTDLFSKKVPSINLETCKASDLENMADFSEEKAKRFVRERSRGIIYYDLNSLAEAFEIQPHEMVKLLDLNIVFAKRIVKRGRSIDF